jgi:type III pantothenate kinase
LVVLRFMRTLCIDIGNTRTKLGYFEGKDLSEVKELSSDPTDLSSALNTGDWQLGILSNVRADLEFLEEYKSTGRLLEYGEVKLPIEIDYHTPNTLGADRVCGAIGAWSHFEGANVLSIDMGTCITFDLIVEGKYLGGKISPGLNVRLKSMHEYTGRLPLVEWFESRELGQSTDNSLRSGAFYGILHELNGSIESYSREFEELQAALTGGDSILFAEHLKNHIFADPNLVLRGLQTILLHNEL